MRQEKEKREKEGGSRFAKRYTTRPWVLDNHESYTKEARYEGAEGQYMYTWSINFIEEVRTFSLLCFSFQATHAWGNLHKQSYKLQFIYTWWVSLLWRNHIKACFCLKQRMVILIKECFLPPVVHIVKAEIARGLNRKSYKSPRIMASSQDTKSMSSSSRVQGSSCCS